LNFIYSITVASCFPNLRHLQTTYFPESVNPQLLLQLKNLAALEISYKKQTFKVLALIGLNLKELKFKWELKREKESSFDLLNVFAFCPNLENFEFLDFNGDINFQVPVLPENLKLKKLYLMGNFAQAEGFLPFILSAPLLEDIELNPSDASQNDFQKLETLLASGLILQNATSVSMGGYFKRVSTDLFFGLQSFAKNIISFCPTLKTAKFDDILGWEEYENAFVDEAPCSIGPFLDLMQMDVLQ